MKVNNKKSFKILIFLLFFCFLIILNDRSINRTDDKLIVEKTQIWKDEWITDWINKQSVIKTNEKYIWSNDGCDALMNNIEFINDEIKKVTDFKIEKYIPARCLNKSLVHDQLINRVIWQTWKGTSIGKSQYKSMSSVILLNPDYEYIMFTDEDCEEFICKFYDERVQRAYQLLRPGAAKSDIWRLAIILRYGGIYVDSDVVVKKSFNYIIDPTASVVSGMGITQKDLHQWLLIYTPNHPFIREALKAAVNSVLDCYEKRKFVIVEDLTGPNNFHRNAVVPVLRKNGCTLSVSEASILNLEHIYEGHACSQTEKPEKIGRLQLFKNDYLNDYVVFKVDGIDGEKANMNKDYKRYREIYKFEELFYEINATTLCDR